MGRGPLFTNEQIEESIAKAIGDHDFEVVIGLIKMLARQDPDRAQVVLDTINLGLELNRKIHDALEG